jgi:hypothetical protein
MMPSALVTLDRRQEVVEVVRHATGQPAECLELLGLAQLVVPHLRFFVPVPQAGGHRIDRRGHRRFFGAAANRQLSGPVAAGDVLRGIGQVLDRAAHPAAEEDAHPEGEQEDDGAGAEQAPADLIDERLRGRPVVEQHQPRRCRGTAIE